MFGIGHSATSCTATPSYYPLSEDMYLVDCPGFGDSDTYKEFPNLTLVHQVIKYARSLIICFVVKTSTIEASAGSDYLKVMTAIYRVLSQEGVDNSKLFLQPLINEPQGFKSQKLLENKLAAPIKIIEQKKEAYENNETRHPAFNLYKGSEYPRTNELSGMLKLLQSVIESYRVISPMEDPKHFKKYSEDRVFSI